MEHFAADQVGVLLVRPDRKDEKRRYGNLAGMRQWIESVNDTLKGQLDLERHGGRTGAGVYARVAQRLLALAAAIWHNWATGRTRQTLTDRLRPLTATAGIGITRLAEMLRSAMSRMSETLVPDEVLGLLLVTCSSTAPAEAACLLRRRGDSMVVAAVTGRGDLVAVGRMINSTTPV